MKHLGLIVALVIAVACQAQKKTPEKGNWEVNKTYDKDGNLIAYDSVYTWRSGDYHKHMSKTLDSVFAESFHQKFKDFHNVDSVLKFHHPEMIKEFKDMHRVFMKEFMIDGDSIHKHIIEEIEKHVHPPQEKRRVKEKEKEKVKKKETKI